MHVCGGRLSCHLIEHAAANLDGMQAGTRLFAEQFGFADVSRFDIRADYDEDVPVPVSSSEQPVPAKYREFLQYFPNWATTPDFYRVSISISNAEHTVLILIGGLDIKASGHAKTIFVVCIVL